MTSASQQTRMCPGCRLRRARVGCTHEILQGPGWRTIRLFSVVIAGLDPANPCVRPGCGEASMDNPGQARHDGFVVNLARSAAYAVDHLRHGGDTRSLLRSAACYDSV